jgi:hypothetical protein
MKSAKISLILATLISSNTFAFENTDVFGDIIFNYATNNEQTILNKKKQNEGLFSQDNSSVDIGLHLDLVTNLSEAIYIDIGMQVVSTLGLENNLVSNGWSGAHPVSTSAGNNKQADTATWVDEIWFDAMVYNTIIKIGRQVLETPLAFSEEWGADKNTFEAVVLTNKSIENTTLITAYIGNSNGSADDEAEADKFFGTDAQAGYVAGDGKFSTFGADGAYIFAMIYSSWKPLTTQVWYYHMTKLANAYWLQSDLKFKNVLAGIQIANTSVKSVKELDIYLNKSTGFDDVSNTRAISAMLGYKLKNGITLKVAYSDVSDGTLGMANTATGEYATNGGESKLYTEMWDNFGVVSSPGAKSQSFTAETTYYNIEWFAGLYSSDIDNKNSKIEQKEVTVAALKTYGPLDISLAIILDERNTKSNVRITKSKSTGIQVSFDYYF